MRVNFDVWVCSMNEYLNHFVANLMFALMTLCLLYE